jgi:hypothetical protein
MQRWVCHEIRRLSQIMAAPEQASSSKRASLFQYNTKNPGWVRATTRKFSDASSGILQRPVNHIDLVPEQNAKDAPANAHDRFCGPVVRAS